MYCDNCGTEINFVPDFEPEVENEINATLSGVADELNKDEKAKEEKRVIDATRGKAIGSVMFMRANNMVVLSNISVDTIIKNMKKTK